MSDKTMTIGDPVLVAIPNDPIQYPVSSACRYQMGIVTDLYTWRADGEEWPTALVDFGPESHWIETQYLISERS